MNMRYNPQGIYKAIVDNKFSEYPGGSLILPDLEKFINRGDVQEWLKTRNWPAIFKTWYKDTNWVPWVLFDFLAAADIDFWTEFPYDDDWANERVRRFMIED